MIRPRVVTIGAAGSVSSTAARSARRAASCASSARSSIKTARPSARIVAPLMPGTLLTCAPTALRFLIWLDLVFGGRDEQVRDAALYGLQRLVEAPYPGGAWPVLFEKRSGSENIPPNVQA